FHPLIIQWWGLEKLEVGLRASAGFVNLYSKWRGQNRFTALLQCFELLHEWPACVARAAACHTELPRLEALRAYCNSGLALGNPTLKQEAERTGDPELKRLLGWSLAVNADIDQNMAPVPPFPWALRALEIMREKSDCIVVSQTPEAALVKEWQLHKMDSFVRVIAGQELGTKAEHLTLAAGGKYAPGRVLMVGDALGDLKAAEKAGALFYPIMPRDENAAWQRYCEEGYPRFLNGTFTGAYEDDLKAAFLAALPDKAPWEDA
ncbi:MAG: HAD family hydrolase, partial [Kiritimatiellaeota bacterium]|nr:HAD family hydrolase [Kiritimatiellota bacterium]